MLRIASELVEQLRAPGVGPVMRALESAIQLEHATIPPYLYALYSLDRSKNADIASIVRSVVLEEMLHLTLGCNMLNALGGAPRLNSPEFIPKYPGHLPGTVQGDIEVGLAPLTIELVRDVFMEIEEPDRPIEFPAARAAVERETTLGDFYRAIRERVVALGDGPFAGVPRHQIGPDLLDRAIIVTDAATAVQAIDLIVGQGEGTARDPGEVIGRDYAHYYRFAEIVHAKRLIRNPKAAPGAPPDEQYEYAGAPVVLDPLGVYAAPTNPTAATYAVGSPARRQCDSFNSTYTALLGQLHSSVNGNPGQLQTALGLMMSLEQQASDMMCGLYTDGVAVGPTFEYLPVL
jgi:hypothetical protein